MPLWLPFLLTGCVADTGGWALHSHGELEVEFDDDCTLDVLEMNSQVAARIKGPAGSGQVGGKYMDLTGPNPRLVGTAVVPTGRYDTVTFEPDGQSLRLIALLACGDGTPLELRLSFTDQASFECPADITVDRRGNASSEYTVWLDTLFRTTLDDDYRIEGTHLYEMDQPADVDENVGVLTVKDSQQVDWGEGNLTQHLIELGRLAVHKDIDETCTVKTD